MLKEYEKIINILQRQIDSGCSNTNEKLAIHLELQEKTKKQNVDGIRKGKNF